MSSAKKQLLDMRKEEVGTSAISCQTPERPRPMARRNQQKLSFLPYIIFWTIKDSKPRVTLDSIPLNKTANFSFVSFISETYVNLHNHNLSPGKSFWKGFSKPTNIFIEVSVVAAVCPAIFESLWPCLVVEGAIPDLGGPWAQKANPAEAQGWQLAQDQESLQRDAQEMKRCWIGRTFSSD